MIHSIGVVRGGMTRAALHRANLLSDYYEEIGLVTFDFNPDYEEEIRRLEEIGLWNEKMKHYNVYEFLMGKQVQGEALSHQSPEEEEYVIQKSNKHPELYHCFQNGKLVKNKIYENNQLRYVDLFDDRKKLKKRLLFDRKGQVRKETFYDRETQTVTKERFLTPSGACFLEQSFDRLTENTLGCIWYNEKGEKKKTFKIIKHYRNYFINSLIENKEAAVLVSDGRFSDRIIFGNNNPKIVKVAVLHSNHLKYPYHYGSALVERNKQLIGNLHKLDALVTLTERQADDIKKRFGQLSTIHVVGHAAPPVKTNQISHDGEPYTAVMLARYVGIKQIPHAIKAFKKVVKQVPQARLEIYGFGKEEEKYKRLVKRLKLENHVFINGFANDITKIYQRAAFSVITSKSEAFAMAIVESLSQGTPVISYDCKYGPSEMIQHGKNGLLVNTNDINGLAAAMVELFLNKEKRNALSREAKKITEKYGQEIIAEKWIEVFAKALKQKEQRVHLKEINAGFTNISYDEENAVVVEGNLYIKKDKNINSLVRQHVTLSLQLRRQKELEDLYVPLNVRWMDDNVLNFNGKVANIQELSKGKWNMNISCVCLNCHHFIQAKVSKNLIFDSRKKRIAKTMVKLIRDKQHVWIKVIRSGRKERYHLNQRFQNYKAKIRDKLGLVVSRF